MCGGIGGYKAYLKGLARERRLKTLFNGVNDMRELRSSKDKAAASSKEAPATKSASKKNANRAINIDSSSQMTSEEKVQNYLRSSVPLRKSRTPAEKPAKTRRISSPRIAKSKASRSIKNQIANDEIIIVDSSAASSTMDVEILSQTNSSQPKRTHRPATKKKVNRKKPSHSRIDITSKRQKSDKAKKSTRPLIKNTNDVDDSETSSESWLSVNSDSTSNDLKIQILKYFTDNRFSKNEAKVFLKNTYRSFEPERSERRIQGEKKK